MRQGILPTSKHTKNIFKVYEKILYNQLYSYFDNILFPNQFGFRKAAVLSNAFKESIDKGHQFGALLRDLLKPFDCHLIAI